MNFLKGLYTQNDFGKLTTEDISYLQKQLDLQLEKETDVREYLYKNIDTYEANEEFKRVISSKVLAGKTALKWKRFYYAGDFTENELVRRMETQQVGYNSNTVDRWDPNAEDGIVCIQRNGMYYTVRLVINDGYNKISDGIQTHKVPAKKTVIINIDVKNRWVEYRCAGNLIDKAENILKRVLKIDNLADIPITNKYGSIEAFKQDLNNGFRFSNISIPDIDIQLTETNKRELVELFDLIDGYITERDGDALLKGLNALELDLGGNPVLQIILSNISCFTLDVSVDSQDDMGQSLMYMLTKNYAADSGAYLRFSIDENGQVYTIRVSVKESSVCFSSSATEEAIEYIRNKVI